MPESNQIVEFSFDGQSYQTTRVIGDLGCAEDGPTLVFFGAVHGNEPTGAVALIHVLQELKSQQVEMRGRILGLVGNMQALADDRRFIHEDLNRIWTRQRLSLGLDDAESAETREQNQLNTILQELLIGEGDRYFFDLHTTSSHSPPFVAINDQMANRDFAAKFPVSTIFGIEEYLHGPLLSYLNDFGHVAFAFEAGQHVDPQSVKTHMAFIKLAIVHAGLVEADQGKGVIEPKKEEETLRAESETGHRFFEVVHRENIDKNDDFKMEEGFENFTPIRKGQLLAKNKKGRIGSRFNGQIFMPLYQDEGTDGFFVIRRIPAWAIWLSRFLRGIDFDRFLCWMPGVSRMKDQPDTLVVNKRVAFLLRNQLFHLLGYRRKQDHGSRVLYMRREMQVK